MPSPELIDFDRRFEHIVRELRATAPSAPTAVRARVQGLAASSPDEQPLRRRLGGRRLALVLVPVCVAGLIAGTLLSEGNHGTRSGSPGADRALPAQPAQKRSPRLGAVTRSADEVFGRTAVQAQTLQHPAQAGALQHGAAAGGGASRSLAPANLPPNRRRLQHYDVSLSLRVRDQDALSKATNEAMQLTRRFGGFVAGVDYSSAEGSRGDATLTLRVPIARIDEAIARFSRLGKIRAQRVSIQDLQTTVNVQNRAILDTRKAIATLQEKLLDSSLPAARRLELQHQLAAQENRLKALLDERGGTIREGRLTTVSLALTTAKQHSGVAHRPGRIGRAAHDAVALLARLGAAVVYLAILLSPLLVLAALVFFTRRSVRRRQETRLLAEA